MTTTDSEKMFVRDYYWFVKTLINYRFAFLEQLASQNEALSRLVVEKDNEIRLLKLHAGGDQTEKILALENRVAVITSELMNQRHLVEMRDNEIVSLKRQLADALSK